MKVIHLSGNERVYSCNSYLVGGNWNTLEDINALVDVETDGSIIADIKEINTGVGKKPVEQVVITHNHSDHGGGIREINARCIAKIHFYEDFEGVGDALKNGQVIRAGTRKFEVIHAPGHSSDSICLYCEEEKTLFSGDVPVRIMTAGGSYFLEFISAFENISRRSNHAIYRGHDPPILEGGRRK